MSKHKSLYDKYLIGAEHSGALTKTQTDTHVKNGKENSILEPGFQFECTIFGGKAINHNNSQFLTTKSFGYRYT